jgi:hypothetical protein
VPASAPSGGPLVAPNADDIPHAYGALSEKAFFADHQRVAILRQRAQQTWLHGDGALFAQPKKMPRLLDRDVMGIYLDHLDIKGAGLEIGVRHGDFSMQVLSRWTGCSHYILVDPWEHYAGYKNDGANVNQNQMDTKYSFVKKHIVENPQFRGKVSMLRMFSHDAAKLIPDQSLSFVYIDGNHFYKYVKADLNDFWAKLAPGGMMAGHDWTFSKFDGGVPKAVKEFVAQKKIKLRLTDPMRPRDDITNNPKERLPPCCPSFYFFKPGGVRV